MKMNRDFDTSLSLIAILFISCFIFEASCSNALKKEKKESNSEVYITDMPLHNLSGYGSKHESEILNNRLDDNFATSNNNEIVSLSRIYIMDTVLKSCDIPVLERIQFKFPTQKDKIEYVVISKKVPMYGFKVVPYNNKNVEIVDTKLYKDTSFKTRVFVDNDNKKMAFRDRWMISVKLNKPVNEIGLEFSYSLQRIIIIDSISETNFLKIELINSYSYDIPNHTTVFRLLNIDEKYMNSLRLPIDTIMTRVPSGFEITSHNIFKKHVEYEVQLTLPFLISSCEGSVASIVYYGLIGMSLVFLIISIYTLIYLYKE